MSIFCFESILGCQIEQTKNWHRYDWQQKKFQKYFSGCGRYLLYSNCHWNSPVFLAFLWNVRHICLHWGKNVRDHKITKTRITSSIEVVVGILQRTNERPQMWSIHSFGMTTNVSFLNWRHFKVIYTSFITPSNDNDLHICQHFFFCCKRGNTG